MSSRGLWLRTGRLTMVATNAHGDSDIRSDADNEDDNRGLPRAQSSRRRPRGWMSAHAMDALMSAPLTLVSANRSANGVNGSEGNAASRGNRVK